MNPSTSALHKILKDKTRQKIILTLEEKGSLTYSQLLDAADVKSTGRLNYHLKILDDLVNKNESGKYALTEKGSLAFTLIRELDLKSQSQIEAEPSKGFITEAIIVAVGYLGVVFAIYLLSMTTFTTFALNIAATISGVILLYFGEKARKKRSLQPANRQMLRAKIAIMAFTAWEGAVVGFFLGGYLLAVLLQHYARQNIDLIASNQTVYNFFFWIGNPVIGVVIGGVVGYFIFKASRYSKNRYYNPFAENQPLTFLYKKPL